MVTGLVARREFSAPRAAASPPARAVANWREFATGGNRMGPPGAAVTIVEFSDFQCPFCKVMAPQLSALRRKYPRDVAVIYRHFPLRTHARATDAARASECAAAQGHFEQYHDALFARQESIRTRSWLRYAADADVPDTMAFRQCVNARAPLASLEQDTLAGRRLGVTATPTLLINGKLVVGAVPADTLEAYVADALARARAPR